MRSLQERHGNLASPSVSAPCDFLVVDNLAPLTREYEAASLALRSRVGGRANLLACFALFDNDPGRINRQADEVAKVTAADVQRVAQKYLVKTGRTVVISVPKAPATNGGL